MKFSVKCLPLIMIATLGCLTFSSIAYANTCPVIQSTTQIDDWNFNGVVKPGAAFIKVVYDPTLHAITCVYGKPNDFTDQFNLVSIFIADAPSGDNWQKLGNANTYYLVCKESLAKCQFTVPSKLHIQSPANGNTSATPKKDSQ